MSIKAKTFLNKISKRTLRFGALLVSLRKSNDITQVELAERVGVSKGLICDIEKGRRVASIELAAKIAHVMGHSKEAMIKQIFEDQLRDAKIKLKVKLEAA